MHNPLVPETLEGWSLLHQAFHLDWRALQALDPAARRALADEAAPLFARPSDADGGGRGQSILVQLLGHKSELLLVHARRTFDELSQAQLDVARLKLASVLTPAWSYVSIVELGMYDMTAKLHEQLGAGGSRRAARRSSRRSTRRWRRRRAAWRRVSSRSCRGAATCASTR